MEGDLDEMRRGRPLGRRDLLFGLRICGALPRRLPPNWRRKPAANLCGWVTLLELLQGARNDDHAARIEPALRQYSVVPLLGAELAIRTARNYRILRGMGITIRKTADMNIGTFCIENHHLLLHDDRYFVPMEQHLGLMVA